jgi:hypothetical protein
MGLWLSEIIFVHPFFREVEDLKKQTCRGVDDLLSILRG